MNVNDSQHKASPGHTEGSVVQSGHERRRAPRAHVLLRVDYKNRDDFAADYVTDLGVGGIFIRTELELPVGSQISLNLSFPGLLEPTEVEAVVRWVRRPGHGVPTDQVGVGVEFTGGDEQHRSRLLSLVSQLENTKKEPRTRTRKSFRVLLVEDNAFVSELFRHAVMKFRSELEDCREHEVMIARTGHEALRLLESKSPDMVIVDHYLPGITGCALIRKIRKTQGLEATPVLMISVGGAEIRREALEAGATLYMDKPILLTQLLDTLRALLSKEASCH
jgi:uncharacterized protein (TIGR02266 family)